MKLSYKFLLPQAVLLLVIIGFVYFAGLSFAKNIVNQSRSATIIGELNKQVLIFKHEDLLKTTIDTALEQKMTDFSHSISDPSIFLIKIWDKDLKVVFSNAASQEGKSADTHSIVVSDLLKSGKRSVWVAEKSNKNESGSALGEHINVFYVLKDNNNAAHYVVEVDATNSAIFGIIQSGLLQGIFYLLGLMTLILLLGYLVMEIFVLRPIKKLIAIMKAVAAGDFSQQITATSKDEIGTLYENFGQMTTELKTSYSNIEQRVTERTGELSQKVAELEKFKELTVGRELKMIELKERLENLEKERPKEKDKT